MLEFSFRDPAAISYGLGTLAFLAFSVHLGLGWRGGLRASILLGTIILSALWAAADLGFVLTAKSDFWTAQAILDALRVSGWLLFVAMLLGGRRAATAGKSPQEAQTRTSFRGATWWALALLLVPAAVWFFPPGLPVRGPAFATAPSRLPYGLLLGVSVIGLVLTEQVFRRALEQARWSIKPLCLGLGASFVFDLYMYADALLFGRLDANIWAARGFAQALAIPFIALATARNKEWTIDIALSRGVVLHSTAFLASGIYLLTVAAAGYYVRYFGGDWGRTFQVALIFAALLLLGWLFSSGTLRSKLKVFINKNFYSYRYDYREEWLRFTNLLSTPNADASIPQRCIQALANLVESPAGALWLRGDDEEVFTQAARWNLPDIQAQERADHPLLRFLRTTNWVINLREYHAQPSRYPELRLPEWLETLPAAWLIVPIVAQDELMGFTILTTPRAALEVNWEVRDLLKTAARHVGTFLAQIRSSEALLEARKFDAFNKMATFVVHDLKNLVAQLSLLLKNAERHRENPRFQDDMLSTVKHVEERMNKLLLQLSAGARSEQPMRPVNLGRLAERVTGTKTGQRTDIALEVSGEVVTLAYEQRLERVIGHLVQNAIDATRDGGAIKVRVYAEQEGGCIEITDAGCGMSEDFVREKLFRPFQTTKRNGMGVGAYETAQYVKEVGGRIEADSKPGAGTTIRVILPLHGNKASQERQDREVA